MRRRSILAVALALTVAGCRPKPRAAVNVDPALAMLVPETAVALAGVKVEAVRATALYKRHEDELIWSAFSKSTGLDLKKDVWEVLVVFEPSAPVVLARGKFSPGFGGLEPQVLPGAPRTPYKSYTIIGGEQAATAFLNSSTAVAGSGQAVRGIIDRRSDSRGIPSALDEELRRLPPGAQIWAVSAGGFAGLPAPREGNWANLGRIFGLIEAGSLGIDLRNGVELSATGSCGSEENARMLHDSLRGFVGLGRLSAPPNRTEIARMYDAIQIGRRGSEVAVTAKLPLDLAETLISMIR